MPIWLFLVAFLASVSQAEGPASTGDCIHRSLMLILDAESYIARDPEFPGFVAQGELVNGRLEMSFVTINEQDGSRSPILRAGDQFRKMLEHFGDRVKSIAGSWTFGTNLEAFNQMTAKGMSAELAAAQTWTGRQAAKAGYTRVIIERLGGAPGRYQSVSVRFEKPGSLSDGSQ